MTVGPEQYVFDYGRVYLFYEKKMDKALKVVDDFVYSGSSLLSVTRTHPDLITEHFSGKQIETTWLSERAGAHNISPDQLSHITGRIAQFLDGKEGAAVLLEGIEYLSLFNDFPRLQMFIEQVSDLVMASKAILIVPIDPQSMDQRSLARLRRYAEVV